jgi:hypothetical protein
VCHGASSATLPIWFATVNASGRLGVEDYQKDPRVFPFFCGHAVLHQQIAGQTQHVVGMVYNVSDDNAGLAPPLIEPFPASLVATVTLAEG